MLVTHDQDEALSLADQVAVMRHGRVIQTDAPRDLYRAPVDPEVGAFVGGATVVRGQRAPTAARPSRSARPRWPPPPPRARRGCCCDPSRSLVHHQGTGARVEQVHFYGHDASVRLRVLPDGPALVARVAGLDAPEPGAEVGDRGHRTGRRVPDRLDPDLP